MRASRSADRCYGCSLNGLEAAARGTENLLPRIFECCRALVTVGEISDTLRTVFGTNTGKVSRIELGADSHYWRGSCRLRGGVSSGRSGRAGRAIRNAPSQAQRGAQDRCFRRTGLQQFAQERTGALRAVAAEAGDAASWARCCCGPPTQARVPGGHALTVDREMFSREITRAIEAHPLHRNPTRGSVPASRRGHCNHRERAAYERCAGRGNQPADRVRAAVLLRQHQPDRGGGFGRYVDRVSASRYGKSLDGTDDYINCPLNKEQYEAFVEALTRGGTLRAAYRQRIKRRFSKAVCRLKRSRGADARRCASDR